MARSEPEQLERGKRFHKLIQEEWLSTVVDGVPRPERSVKGVTGRRGRVDILVEELGELVAVVEIKASDWDRMTAKNVVRNVRRQIRQILSYVDSQLEIYRTDVSPGVIFPHLPRDPDRVRLIERMFNGEGIQVVWHDESGEGLRRRMSHRQEEPPQPSE